MVNKIAFINGKGGCGKTTSIFHVAGVLSKQGEKVLVIDLDSQCNTTDTMLMNVDTSSKPKKTVLSVMQGTARADEATAKALFQSRGNAKPKYYNVDCLAANEHLDDELLLSQVHAEQFGEELDRFEEAEQYTWVLVDMPPSNAVLNDICFSYIVNFVIVPFSSDIFSVNGYGKIINSIDNARQKNPTLNLLGVFLARYMENCKLDKFIREQMLQFDTFIDIQIPLAADIREAVMFGRPISYYRDDRFIGSSRSRRAYEELVGFMRKRIQELS
jgi:chromosome partitioning protein